MDDLDLSERICEPCQGGVPPLAEDEADRLMKLLDPGWERKDGKIVRHLTFKGFAQPTFHANLAAFIGNQQGHHPDIAFGWGYCTVTFTTHEAPGLTDRDFICAAKFDRALRAGAG